jgi:methylenetetrahydrofolate dehydrogenase (NADP+)/methenyltetrahydrofolate cyclohydrolase
MYNLIDGKKTASIIKLEIAEEVAKRAKSGRKIPHLAAIMVGDDKSSVTYVSNKVKDCAEWD